MAEEMTTTQSVQEMILKNVITSGNQSTFIRCTDDNEELEINTIRDYTNQVRDKLSDPAVKKALDEAAGRLKEIYSKTVYCAHCGKLATLVESKEPNDIPLTFTCDCEDAKKEIEEKKVILDARAAEEAKYAKLQTGIINGKCLPIFKEHYKDVMKKRYADFMEYDNCILNLTSVDDGETK